MKKKVSFDNHISIIYISETVPTNIISNNISYYYNPIKTDNYNKQSYINMSKNIFQLSRNANRKKNHYDKLYLYSNKKEHECQTSEGIHNKKFNFLLSCFESIVFNIFK